MADIRDRISELQEQALFINDPDFVIEAIKLFDNGRIHLFDFGDRFTLLMPRDYDDVPCVHVYFACTNKKHSWLITINLFQIGRSGGLTQ